MTGIDDYEKCVLMRQILGISRRIGFGLALILVVSCGLESPEEDEGTYPFSETGGQLATQLAGYWTIRTVSFSTTCPAHHVGNPMNGYTQWGNDQHRVEIQWLTDGMYSMEFWATSSNTLETSKTIEMLGCKVTAQGIISIASLEEASMEAEYRELYFHNEAQVCESTAMQHNFPDRCEVIVKFAAYR